MASARSRIMVKPQVVGQSLVDVEADAIVVDDGAPHHRAAVQADLDALGVGMFGDVVERFLCDAVEGDLDVERQVALGVGDDVDRHTRASRRRLAELVHQVGDGGFGERRGRSSRSSVRISAIAPRVSSRKFLRAAARFFGIRDPTAARARRR